MRSPAINCRLVLLMLLEVIKNNIAATCKVASITSSSPNNNVVSKNVYTYTFTLLALIPAIRAVPIRRHFFGISVAFGISNVSSFTDF